MAKTKIKTEENKMSEKRIKIVGSAVILTSKIKYADLQKMEKYSNGSLALVVCTKDEEYTEVFRVSTGKISNISRYGITFAEANKNGYAMATVLLPEGITDKRAYIKDNLGDAIFKLDELEAQINAQLAAMTEAYKQLDEEIEEVE